MNSSKELAKSLYTGFVDSNNISLEEYHPKLLINDSKNGQKVLTNIINELGKCEEFLFSVAFVTNSGVASLINILKQLEEKGVKGKLIASQYQNFTEPRALKRLIKLTNIEVRIVVEHNFHAKGYIFKKDDTYTLIVGSSNLTQNALSYNKEWNIRVTSMDEGSLSKETIKEFEYTFDNATVVNEKWIKEYEKIYEDLRKVKTKDEEKDKVVPIHKIVPNMMQVEALKALQSLREENKNKALLISATGTGKTYLSVFDVKIFKPKRFLFIVHRENIARAAMKSFRKVLGYDISMGILSGTQKNYKADYLFSTVQTISKDYVREKFDPEEFDYIVIDEVHRSGAATYQKVIEYFKPKFLLGMTATPERMDGYDIFKAFEYNIAYEIRLNKALEENLLCSFHYYGISDIEINGELIDEEVAFNHLVSEERTNKIIEKAQFYGCDQGRVKGLIFCSRVEEARKLSIMFNERGYRTTALDGSSSEDEREEAIILLESDDTDGNYLEYIFTVDIFNEGVDIPAINQIIMLRPTQSSIVFIQQLGRGLRKKFMKEYLVVIDFIGNYKNNFLIPIALYGDDSYNKDNLRKLLSSGNSYIPGASTINFDYITKKRIFEAINAARISGKRDLVKDYKLLKYKLGKIPLMMDFIEHGSRDPYLFVNCSKSYYNFVRDVEEEITWDLSEQQEKILEFISREICNGKRIEEVIILKEILENESLDINKLKDIVNEKYEYIPSDDTINSCINVLNSNFTNGKYKDINCIKIQKDILLYDDEFNSTLNNITFKKYFIDLLHYAKFTFEKTFNIETYINGFGLYNKYSRKDVCRILNWEKDETAVVFGYRIKYNTCPIFVTYHKEEGINESTKYDDKFLSSQVFSWMTKNRRTMNSREVIDIKRSKETGLRILLFVKKSDSEGNDFYYMGDMEQREFIETTIMNDKGNELPIVNIKFKMKRPVDEKLIEYFNMKAE